MFDQMPHRDLVSWASILTALNQANLPHLSLSMLPTMLRHDGLEPDHFVLATLFKACARLDAIRQGKQVHARFLLSPFRDDDVVNSTLIDMYVKCGLPDNARAVFDSISLKNSVPWTAMISGYARSGRKLSGSGVDAFHLFIEMRREGVDLVDPLVLSSTIGASANLAVLELGKQMHGLVISLGYDSCIFISNALVDMYAKCSDILAANEIFGSMQRRDVVSWTSIIVGVARHGQAEEALALYDEMISAGVKPNEVTFVGLIYACSHVGLVSKGRQLFKSMIEDYGISPSLQHYTSQLAVILMYVTIHEGMLTDSGSSLGQKIISPISYIRPHNSLS
jgi:pentatricopeptide repeat protein